FKNVWFSYKTKAVLKNINVRIKKGQTIALVGHSGSGKSTFIDLIPRFYDVSEGSVNIDGIDIRSLDLADLRKLLGYVHQEALLFNESFKNNIAFGSKEKDERRIQDVARAAQAEEFILEEEEGLERNIGDRGNKLSGGQKQRISIARALYANPDILLLDEATSALDSESERKVQEALDVLMKGRTTIVVAHRLSTIMNADLILVFKDGEIVEQGQHEELIKAGGEYLHLYKESSA
ncbi:MAG: ATP-binding cassette domain-containing protein, partial [Bacteroidetes bacterium]|nr:ATP-binding cassette domain-containing protein [Bacteroidota bacterium]